VIRVLLVDDHQLVRAGVTTLLQSDPGITVVGEARNGREAVDSVVGTNPDVVLMDLSMPEMDGVEATRAVLALQPGTRVLVLTSFSDRQRVKEVLAAGAIGYVLKDSEPADLLAAAHAAAGGHVPTDPRVAAALLPATGGGGGPGAADGLSPRETEVLPPGRAGPGEQADRAGAGHHRAHRQGPPRAGVPRDRRARPHERGPVGPRQPSRRLIRRSSASDTHGARHPRSACHLLSTQPPDAVAPRVAGLP
jgi:DNA-binding NarL/FixJ family response regulator